MSEKIVRLPTEDNGEKLGLVNDSGSLLGAIEIRYVEGTVEITNLYVNESYRRRGYGTRLVQSVADRINATGFFMPYDAFFTDSINNDSLRHFFESQSNFELIRHKSIYSLQADVRRELKTWKKLVSSKTDAVPLSSLKKRHWRHFLDTMTDRGYDMYVEKDASVYDPNLSFVLLKDSEITTAILFKKHSDSELELSFLFGKSDYKRVIKVLAASAGVIDEHYPEALIWMCPVTPSGVGAIDGFLKGEVKPETVWEATWNGATAREMFNMADY